MMKWSGIDEGSGVEIELIVEGNRGENQVIHFKGVTKGESDFFVVVSEVGGLFERRRCGRSFCWHN